MRGPASGNGSPDKIGHRTRRRGWLAACLLGLSPWLDAGTLIPSGLIHDALIPGALIPSAQAQEAKPSAKPPTSPAAKPDGKADAKPESSPEALALYSDAASFQNNMAFDLAVEEWGKFLAKFPKDPLAAKAQHYLGVCQLQLKEFAKAAAAFESVVKANPKFELLEETTFNLGLSYYSQASAATPKPYAQAAVAFQGHLEKFPKGKQADQATFYLAESEYHQGRKKEAVGAYERVVKQYPQSTVRADAAYAWGVTLEELGDFPAAGGAYDLFLKEFANNPLATEVGMRKAETVLQAGQFADAAKRFEAVGKVEGFSQADYAGLRRGFCLVKLEQYAEAAAVYADVAKRFPQSTIAREAELSAGRWFYRVEKFDDAAPWLRKAFDANGAEAPEAGHWLARIAIRGGKPADAIATAEKAIAAAAKSPYLTPLKMDRADALYELPEKRTAALEAYRQVFTDHGDHELAPQALYNVAFGELELKQYDAAVKDAAAFLEKFAQHRLAPDVQYVAAESLLLANKYAEADQKYQTLVKAHGSHRDAGLWRVRWALAQYLQKKYDAVVDTLAKTDGLEPADLLAEAHYLVGASRFFTDKYAESAPALAASLKASAKWRQADETLLLLSRAQAKLNQVDAARESAKRLLGEFPASKSLDQANYRLGEYAYAANDFAAAVASYDVVIAKFADSQFTPYALYGKGWSLARTKQHAPAVEAFTTLIDKHPQHSLIADARYGRGLSRRQTGDAKNAVADFDAYLATNPPLDAKSNARYERGLALVAIQDFAAAATTFEQLLKDHPKYSDADKVRYELAWAWKSQGKNEEAVTQFRTLTVDYPSSTLAGEGHFHVGESLYEQKKFDEAAKEYAAARQKTAAGEMAEKSLYKLGWSHFQLKQYPVALEQFASQLDAYPQGPLSADSKFMKAECLFKTNKFMEALPAFKEAVASESLSEVMRSLGWLHGGQAAAQLKQWKDSVALLDQLIEKTPQSPYVAEAFYERGWAKQNLNQAAEALGDYEQASTSRDTVGARARFMIGELRFDQKQYDDAIKDFQRVMFGFGGDKAPDDVKVWQAKSGYEAGRCWEVRIEAAADKSKRDVAVANSKRFYTYVVDKHPSDPLAVEARKRLQILK
jgi:cellulose synthase operon protein C